MFCRKCGKEIPDDSAFCSGCGVPVVSSIEPKILYEDDSGALPRGYIMINGQLVYIVDFMQRYRFDREKTVKELSEYTGISVEESTSILEKIYLNKYKSNVLTDKSVSQIVIENKARGIACCPKCGSTSLSANKKGFGVGKAVVGATLTGGIGLIAGNIGAKKVRITCLNCGNQFWPGKV